jgi:hypothetical protein
VKAIRIQAATYELLRRHTPHTAAGAEFNPLDGTYALSVDDDIHARLLAINPDVDVALREAIVDGFTN